ncbi:MAG: hypothetical protein GY771_05170 [bacterium]|nr:hypothetical protein [bacterium]
MYTGLRTFGFTTVLVVALSLTISAQGTDAAGNVIDWNDPATIDPGDPDVLEFLDLDFNGFAAEAASAYEDGDYERAARYYLMFVRSDIANRYALYNLACCYGLLGDAEAASTVLETAILVGFEEIAWIEQDTDFDKIRDTEVYKTTLEGAVEYLEASRRTNGEVIYFDAPSLLEARLQLPADFDPDKTYKLLVGLHGGAGLADEFSGVYGWFDDPDFIMVSLQGPYPQMYGRSMRYNWYDYGNSDTETVERQMLAASDYVLKVIEDVRLSYDIGDVYITGFSQGAEISYLTALKHPDVFAGIIPYTGHIPENMLTEDDYNAASNLRVYIVHGDNDAYEPFANAERAIEILTNAGCDVEIYHFEGEHLMPPDSGPLAQEWLNK